MNKAVFNWSGGKDSAFALQKILQEKQFEVIALLTTINADSFESSIHHIPFSILKQQAESLNIPLYPVKISGEMDGYNKAMENAVTHFKTLGVTHFIFGDIHLHDVKSYRENQLHPYGIKVVTPLWEHTSEEIMNAFLQSGIKTKIVVTQAEHLSKEWVGQDITAETISKLPHIIDVCGENGEYHTLAYSGPLFSTDIFFEIDRVEEKSYCINLEDNTCKTYYYWQAIFK